MLTHVSNPMREVVIMSFFPSLFGHEKQDSTKELKSRIDSVFDNFLKDWPSSGFGEEFGKFLRPAVDVSENKEMLEVQVELPAVDKKDIHLEVVGNQLLLTGEKRSSKEDKKDHGYHLVERSYGSFRRVIPLPFEVANTDNINAAFKDGLLTVQIPKPAEQIQQKNKVEIS